MSDNSKDKKSQEGPEPLPLKRKKVSNPFGPTGKKGRLFPKAMQMYDQDYTFDAIAKECGVHVSTLRRWFRDAGCPPKKNKWQANPKPWADHPDHQPTTNIFDGNEHLKNKHAVEQAAENAHQDESQRMTDIAAAQVTPADQYQSYMASNAVRLMRDGLKVMAPPKNVREMEVLDKIARRHFGLDEKQSGGANSLSIDINILNDAAAAARKQQKKNAIDVEDNEKDV